PRTVGLLSGRDVLTVPDMRTKLLLQLAGAGYGFLPEPYARGALQDGRLREVQVETHKPDETFYLAWRPGEEGEALGWWRRALRSEGLFDSWLHALAATYRSVAAGQSPR
ncbi:LysR family transcriptional regulator, partial [Xanthomonas oryzae pv. oryzae]